MGATTSYVLLHLIYHIILQKWTSDMHLFYIPNRLICQQFDHVILVVKIDCEVHIAHNRATYT